MSDDYVKSMQKKTGVRQRKKGGKGGGKQASEGADVARVAEPVVDVAAPPLTSGTETDDAPHPLAFEFNNPITISLGVLSVVLFLVELRLIGLMVGTLALIFTLRRDRGPSITGERAATPPRPGPSPGPRTPHTPPRTPLQRNQTRLSLPHMRCALSVRCVAALVPRTSTPTVRVRIPSKLPRYTHGRKLSDRRGPRSGLAQTNTRSLLCGLCWRCRTFNTDVLSQGRHHDYPAQDGGGSTVLRHPALRLHRSASRVAWGWASLCLCL